MMKERNQKIVIGLMVLLVVLGSMLFVYGLKSGQDIAIQLSKPVGETAWSTSREQMNLAMYGISGLGALWIIAAHVLFIVYVAKNFMNTAGSAK